MDIPDLDPFYKYEIQDIVREQLGPEVEELVQLARRVSQYQGHKYSPEALLGQDISDDYFYLNYDVFANTKAGRVRCEVTVIPFGANDYAMILMSDEAEPRRGEIMLTKHPSGNFHIEEELLGDFTLTSMFDAVVPAKNRYSKIVEQLEL